MLLQAAHVATNEEGCYAYELCISGDNPDKFIIYERCGMHYSCAKDGASSSLSWTSSSSSRVVAVHSYLYMQVGRCDQLKNLHKSHLEPLRFAALPCKALKCAISRPVPSL
jgi:hypothetical protein